MHNLGTTDVKTVHLAVVVLNFIRNSYMKPCLTRVVSELIQGEVVSDMWDPSSKGFKG